MLYEVITCEKECMRMDIKIIESDNSHVDFIALSKQFDDELNKIYGERNNFV